jgi:hypothetical protein
MDELTSIKKTILLNAYCSIGNSVDESEDEGFIVVSVIGFCDVVVVIFSFFVRGISLHVMVRVCLFI